MCGRFTLTDPDPELAVQFNLPQMPELQPRYNIAPTQPVAAVRLDAKGAAREMVLFYWGLIPFWAKDPSVGARLINARSETAAEKPAFRAAFRHRRCLVVADGFYEWQKQNGRKQPFYIRLRDEKPFAFAGLWERWEGPDGSVIQSCTLLTTEPNALMQQLHNRMPVILHPGDYDLWLDRDVQDATRLQPLLRPFPATEMIAYPVSRRVNSPENDDPQVIEPLLRAEDQPLPGL
jgi:putative SOS response-associated peptidase YedK